METRPPSLKGSRTSFSSVLNPFGSIFQVQTPSGMARTHKFATETVDLPAQEGERVTIASAAPSNVYRNVGPFKFVPKAPNRYPGEPMSLTNHENSRESPLLRAPVKDGNFSMLNPSVLIPLLAVLATGDAASGIIDPSLPQFLSVAAIASLGVGATLNTFVIPQLNQVSYSALNSHSLLAFKALVEIIFRLFYAVQCSNSGCFFFRILEYLWLLISLFNTKTFIFFCLDMQ